MERSAGSWGKPWCSACYRGPHPACFLLFPCIQCWGQAPSKICPPKRPVLQVQDPSGCDMFTKPLTPCPGGPKNLPTRLSTAELGLSLSLLAADARLAEAAIYRSWSKQNTPSMSVPPFCGTLCSPKSTLACIYPSPLVSLPGQGLGSGLELEEFQH